MRRLIVDIETGSEENLLESDAWRYSRHMSTRIHSLVLNEGGKRTLFDYGDCQSPKSHKMQALYRQLVHPETLFVAHNAPFELYNLLNIYGWEIDPSRVICTLAKAAYYHLPMKLDKAAIALKLPILKDTGEGYQIMLKLSKYNSRKDKPTPETHAEDFKKLYSYCDNDTEVTRLLDNALPDLSAYERKTWVMDYKINQRGVPIDWFLVHNANKLIAEEKLKIDEQIKVATNGELNSARQTVELAKWLTKTTGSPIKSVAKEMVSELLTQPWLTPQAKKVLKLRQQAGLSSLAKFQALESAMDDTDKRIRDNFWYYGAHTGRRTGKGVQLHNLYRGCDLALCDALANSDSSFIKSFYPDPLSALPLALRGAIYSGSESTFMGVDLSQIEARCTAWLGNQEDTLDVYRKGEDVYCKTASRLFNRTVTKKDKLDRDAGKTAELSLGFGGGIGALERGAKKFGVDIEGLARTVKPTEVEIEKAEGGLNWYYNHQGGTLEKDVALGLEVIKLRWRAQNSNTVKMWKTLFDGFITGTHSDSRIKIKKTPTGTRVVTLPSGRQLFYHAVIIDDGGVSYLKRVKGDQQRTELTAGKFFENLVQGMDHDVIVFYQLFVDEIAPIIIHVHDEYILEVANTKFAEVEKAVHKVHQTKFPNWAPGLPIAYEMWQDVRYSK